MLKKKKTTASDKPVSYTHLPVSNSMTELYTMQRYLQYERLQELNMTHFDCWASRFGETVTALEDVYKRQLYNQMLLSEKLYPHLLEIDETAQSRLEQMMPQLAKEAGATEELKASDPMKWVGLMRCV